MRSKFTNEQVVAAYKETGSVWLAAARLGLAGQTIWERLRSLGYPLFAQKWSTAEIGELRRLAPACTIGEIARQLARPYAGVAGKISELGIGVRYGNSQVRTLKRGSGFTKDSTRKLFEELARFEGSVRQFCIQRALPLEIFVQAAQKYEPEAWLNYVRTHSDLAMQKCPQCQRDFIPMTKKQITCSRRCATFLRVDKQYFGGKRSNTIGLKEGICQLCEKEKAKLSSHHVIGKENDPGNDYLIALCAGCHQLVSHLGGRNDVQKNEFWENLIGLAVARKTGDARPMPIGFHVCVEIEELTQEDLESEQEQEALLSIPILERAAAAVDG